MATSDTDPVARLRDLLAGTAKPRSRPASKSKRTTTPRPYTMHPNRRPNRHLIGIALRAAARKTAGKELSPMEEKLISTLKICGGDDVVAGFGKEFINHKRSRAAGEGVFPEAVLQLHDDDAYTREHFLQDVDKIAPEIAAQPEHQIIDINSIVNGTIDSEAYSATLAQMGQGVTVITSGPPLRQVVPDAKSADSGSTSVNGRKELSAAQQTSNVTRTIPPEADLQLEFDHMYCQTSQEGEHYTDEIYLCWGAAADGNELSYAKTKEYEYIVPGTTTQFVGEKRLYSGKFRLTFNAHIEVWESDHTTDAEYDKLIETLQQVADDLLEAAHEGLQSAESRKGAAYQALAGLILELVAFLLDLLRNMDDCLCRRTITIDRAGIVALCSAPNKELKLTFPSSLDRENDKTGAHDVYIRCKSAAPPCGGVMATSVEIAGNDFKVKETQPMSVNSNYGMGLISFKDKLVGIYGRGFQGTAMCMSAPISSNPSWTSPVIYHDYMMASRPALAVIGSKLHVCVRALDDDVKWLWTEDLKKWSPQVRLDSKSGLLRPGRDVFVGSVSMAAFQGHLFLMIVNFDDGSVLRNPEREDKYKDDPSKDPDKTYINPDHRNIMLLELNPDSSEDRIWRPLARFMGLSAERGWRSDFTPGLVTFGNKLYAFVVTDDNTLVRVEFNPTNLTWAINGEEFANDVFSSPSCTATASSVLISYRNKHGTPMLGSLSGKSIGNPTPEWKSHALTDTDAVGDPAVCTLGDSQSSVLVGWSAAYYN